MSLSTNTMLATLSISCWTGQRLDRTADKAVEKDFDAATGAGRYKKNLIDSAWLSDVRRIEREARDYHQRNTLPWLDDGVRILPAARFMAYAQAMRGYRTVFESHADTFVKSYGDAVHKASASLGKLFHMDDYPSRQEIRASFGFATRITPTPDAGDFRVAALDQSAVEEIRQSCAAAIDEASRKAVADLYARLREVVQHAYDRLRDPEAVFRDSLVNNIRELLDLAPALNITADPVLDAAIAEIKELFYTTKPDFLRDDKRLRSLTSTAALDILRKMEGYSGIKENPA